MAARTRQVIAALEKLGGRPKYTEVADGGHNVWETAYADPEGALPWMFQQRRAKRRSPPE